jgi:hypothetical protein
VGAFVSGVAVLALGGITALAYKQPALYRKVMWAFALLVNFVILWPIYAWDMAINTLFGQMFAYIQPDKFSDAQKLSNNLKFITSPFLFFACVAGVTAWLVFLYFLQDLNLTAPRPPTAER